MSELGNRQRGNLNGRLSEARLAAGVVILAADPMASSPTGQHLLWMLCNLLARQADEVGAILVQVNPMVKALPGLTPLVAGQDLSLKALLEKGMQAINPRLTFNLASPVVSIQVGDGEFNDRQFVSVEHKLYASACGWMGYTGQVPAPWFDVHANPIGAHVAACLTAGEVFKFLRSVNPDDGTLTHAVWYDAFHFEVASHPDPGLPLPAILQGKEAVLAGVGAVGSAFLHTLHAIPGLKAHLKAVDHDPEGIEESNLNRYVLFGQQHLGEPKASTAAALLAGSNVTLEPFDLTWERWVELHGNDMPDLVLSCVDNNTARHQIQSRLPREILGASTLDLRAQTIHFTRTAGEACLRCGNPLPKTESDAEVILRLQGLTPDERKQHAEKLGVVPGHLETFLTDPGTHCGLISGDTLRKFAGAGAKEWSVGFVSVMAGVMLASQYLRLSLNLPVQRNENLARFQFWDLDSDVNCLTHHPQSPTCTCNSAVYLEALKVLG